MVAGGVDVDMSGWYGDDPPRPGRLPVLADPAPLERTPDGALRAPDPLGTILPMASTPASGPLAGLLVADLSTVLAGPYCTMLLADLGADVIKVEPPEGDGTRAWGPPWVAPGLTGPDDPGTAAYYLAVNRNKRSIRLDLRSPEGAAVLRRLLERADVLVENLRIGGLDRLGFDDVAIRALNPRLVHLAITGFGPIGPDAGRPGYDFVIQALAGLMSITGAPDAAGGGPTKVGVAISDVVTGLFGAASVLGALWSRDRVGGSDGDGGQRIDLSLFASTLAVLVNQAQNAFVTGASPGRRGNAHPNIVPYETFQTADGQIAIAVGSERQWPRCCAALDLADLATDPRFRSNGDRVQHRDALRPILASRIAEATTAEWLDRLRAADVPCGPVADLIEAFDSPQARALGMTVDLEHPVLGPVRQVAPPFALSATPASIRTPPPTLGEHTDEILAELGYDAPTITALHRAGAVSGLELLSPEGPPGDEP
jgi:crotonobetainyl-CoA:carnitine CoA-transferase CaiB-like acyl-CoA transferase